MNTVSPVVLPKKQDMEYTSILGTIAALLTTVSFLPQALKTIKTSDTKSLSLPMYSLFVLGVFLWLLYGLKTDQISIIIGNLITLILAGIILGYKLKELSATKKTKWVNSLLFSALKKQKN